MPEGIKHNQKFLSNISTRYSNESYIADKAFPMLPVKKEIDRIPTFGLDSLRAEETIRANRSSSNRATHTYTFTTYNLEVHALSDVLTQRDLDEGDPELQQAQDIVVNLTDKILLAKEKHFRDIVFTTTSFGNSTGLASTTSWRYNTTTSGVPQIHVASATSAVLLASGKKPDRMIMGDSTFSILKNNVNVLEQVKYTQLGQATPQILQSLFNLKSLLIGETVENTGAEGIADSNTALYSDKALLYWTPATASRRVPSAGYMLARRVRSVKRWNAPELDHQKATMYEVEDAFVMKALATLAAHLITGTDI